jgi:hypothetical protein
MQVVFRVVFARGFRPLLKSGPHGFFVNWAELRVKIMVLGQFNGLPVYVAVLVYQSEYSFCITHAAHTYGT